MMYDRTKIISFACFILLSNGLTLAYTYLNDQSGTLESEDMEKQIRVVNLWIDQILVKIAGQK